MSELSSQSGFMFSTFGATVPVEVSNGKARVEVPETLARDFANAYAFLLTQPNTKKMIFDHPDGPDGAQLFRDQLVQWCADNGKSAYLPKHVPAHWSRQGADPKTGIVMKDGEPVTDPKTGLVIKAKWVADNGVNKRLNNGSNVAFRITEPKSDDDSAQSATESKPAPVVITQGAPVPSAPKSRGQQILGK